MNRLLFRIDDDGVARPAGELFEVVTSRPTREDIEDDLRDYEAMAAMMEVDYGYRIAELEGMRWPWVLLRPIE